MSRDLERAVKRARKRLTQDFGSREGWATLHEAQRRLAEARNQAWAEPLDLGGCQALRIGGPNDEALHGHPLYDRGLHGYGPHLVHNSHWIAEQEAINSVHEHHKGAWHERLNHYFFVFHDEIFEALARSVDVRSHRATMAECLSTAAQVIVEA